jgi:hypothetical protein
MINRHKNNVKSKVSWLIARPDVITIIAEMENKKPRINKR